MSRESRLRSIVKGISWRVTGTIDTILISFLITQKLKLALSIGLIELVTKILIYYVHERIWLKIKWGTDSTTVQTSKNDLQETFLKQEVDSSQFINK